MRLSTLAAGLLALATASGHAQEEIPSFDGYVHDPAGLLDAQMLEPLQLMLQQIGDSGGTRIAVLTVADLAGEPAAQYALRALYEWDGGDGATNTALLLAVPEGIVAVAIGGALLPRMSDTEAQAVLIENVLPSTAQFGLTTGLITGAQSIMVNLLSEEGGSAGDPFAFAGRFDASGSPVLLDAGEPGSAAAQDGAGDAGMVIDPERWLNDMTAALGAAARSAVDSPAAFFGQAGGELQVLPAVLDEVSSRPTVPEQLVVRFILLGLSVALLVFAFRVTRSAAASLGVFGVLAGLWLWQLTGFAALALCVMLAGILFLPVLRLAGMLIRNAAKRDNGGGGGVSGGATGPSQSYQDWLAAQRAKSAARGLPSSAPVTAQKATAKPKPANPPPQESPGPGRLPGGMIDNRSVPSKAGAAPGLLARDRERLKEAGIPTPAIDQLMRAKVDLGFGQGKLDKGKIQMIIIGAAVAVVIFGPIALFALAVLGFVWGRKIWGQIKPAHMSTSEYLKQITKEAEAASKLKR